MARNEIYPNRRPRHAASLLLARIKDGETQFVMGGRSNKHVFMPGYFVFPGGALERADYRSTSVLAKQDVEAMRRLSSGPPTRPQALAQCALREFAEETGHRLAPDRLRLRFLARAITPPRQIRRFDTRFFIAISKSGADLPEDFHPDDQELAHVAWITPSAISPQKLHRITAAILEIAQSRLMQDPALVTHPPIAQFAHQNGKAMRKLLAP